MTLRFLLIGVLAAASVACGDNQGPTPPPAVSGSGGGGAGGTSAGSVGVAGSAGLGGGAAGTGGSLGGGGAGGSAGAGGSGPVPDPTLLSETGLFADMATKTLGEGVYAFEPQYKLWSDTAGKRRWVYLPPGAKIKTDGPLGMDYWTYPAGFKLWKEFERDGKVIETRLLMKRSAGRADWYMVAFKWNADGMDAVALPTGEANAMGTAHDIPTADECKTCHASMYDNALGFSALQLAHSLPGSITLAQIEAMGWLSAPPAAAPALPGDDVTKAAFGYLHANCGMCHNNASNVYSTKAALDLWTHLDQVATVETTRAWLSMVCDEWPGPNGVQDKGDPIKTCTAGHATGTPVEAELSTMAKRVVPGMPAMSAIHELMSLRGGVGDNMKQMPPIGTEMVDDMGLGVVDAWINSLPVQ